MIKKHSFLYILLSCLFISACFSTSQASESIVKKVNGQWQIFVEGSPYKVKGATFGKSVTKENIGTYMKDLKFLGVNTIRTWGTGEETQLLLDSANVYGI